MQFNPSLINQFFEELRSAKSVLIGAHLNPDGDTVGSALAVAHYLDTLNVFHEVLCHHKVPYNLKFLPGHQRIKQSTEKKHFDIGVVVDLSTLDRLGSARPYFELCDKLIVIDHHVVSSPPGDLKLIDSSAPATALILTRLFKYQQIDISDDLATCLLTGIVTDTGSFRFSNTTAESLQCSAELLSAGGRLTEIVEEVYQKKPIEAIRLLSKTLESIQTSHNNQIAWAVITPAMFSESGAIEEYSEGLVSELLSIDSVKIAATLRKYKESPVKVSLRSRSKRLDVAKIASEFGGGGHQKAAGCTLNTSLDQAEKQMIEAIEHCLESSL